MIEARYYQEAATASIFNYYASGKRGNPVVAMPTASGKSIVIAQLIQQTLQRWPQQRFIVATHVKELVQQNFNKMQEAWPECPAGRFSAGLKKRDIAMPIIFGGIQSMVNQVAEFGWRDVLLVDEAHLISGKEDSNYGKFIAGLKAVNPSLIIIGFSATPYRTGHGLISDGPIFTDVCFDYTSMEKFNELIERGYLAPLIPKRTKTELITKDVKIVNGDFAIGELQAAVDKDSVTYAACREMCEMAWERSSWLIFASGVEHAEHVAATIASFGIDAVAVHSKIGDEARDRALKEFKSGELRCVVNNNVLTTGFDHPGLDFIGMLRPTVSTALWVQMLGRGTRPAPGKENCLVADFAGNTKRLGPINDPVIPRKKGMREGTAPVRICDECGAYNHARATICIGCGKKFEFQAKITKTAGTEELIATGMPVIETLDVQRVIYARHQKMGASPIMKCSYFCGLRMFKEYVCFEHKGFALKKAHDWWRLHGFGAPPNSVDAALELIGQLKVPRQIRVWTNKKHPDIMETIF